MFEAPSLIVWFPVYYVFNALLVVLQILHIIWSWMIVKAIYAVVTEGFVCYYVLYKYILTEINTYLFILARRCTQ